MRRFRFRLQKLLEHRRRLEEFAVLALATAREEEAGARRFVAEVVAALEQLDSRRLQAQRDDAWPDVWAIAAMAPRVATQLDAARAALSLAEERTEQARSEAVARLTDRRLVEKLKDHARAAYTAESLAADQKEADDVVTTRHGREGL